MFAQKSTKEDLNFIARFFRRFVDAIKKVFDGNKKYQQYVYDAEKLLGAFERAIKVDGNKKISGRTETRNAVSGNLSITQKAIEALRLIGPKSINKFTSDDIKIAEPFARRMWKTLGTKSPFFRSWFGDWRSNDKNTEIKIATIPEYIATNEARKKNRGLVRNTDTEWDINISRQGETNTISHSGKNKLSEFGLSGIRELIENAVLLDCEVHEHHNNNTVNDYISFDHKLYALGKSTNGSIALYKITVEEYFQSKTEPENKRFHNLRYIEKVADVGGRTFESSRSGGSTDDNSATMYSISDLFNLVKTYDKNFNPKEPSKIVNADGTPKIMYHGSPERFTIFDKKKAKSSGAYGRGFYFTDSDSHAKQYGNLYAVYLDVKNPLKQGETKVTEGQIRKYLEAVAQNEDDYSIENYGTYDISEIMKKIESRDAFAVIQDVNATAIGDMVEATKLWNEVNGTNFDGIVVPTETVVFEPTQIKSATDNIGTFDKENPDIRHAVSSSPANENSVFDDKQRKDVIRKLSTVAKMNGVARLDKDSFVTDAMGILEGALQTGIVSDGVVDELARCLYDYSREDAGDADLAGTYKDIRERINKVGKIYVPESAKNDIPDYDAFRKQFGTLLTTTDKTALEVDKLYNDLKMDYPDIFTEDLVAGDQLQKLADVLAEARKYKANDGLTHTSEIHSFDDVKTDFVEMADEMLDDISASVGIELVEESDVYAELAELGKDISSIEIPNELIMKDKLSDKQIQALLQKVKDRRNEYMYVQEGDEGSRRVKKYPNADKEYKFLQRLFSAETEYKEAQKKLRDAEKKSKNRDAEVDNKRLTDFTKGIANAFGFDSDASKTADIGRGLKGLYDAVSEYIKTGDDAALNKMAASVGDVSLKIGEYSPSWGNGEKTSGNKKLPNVSTKSVENIVKDKNKARTDFITFSKKFPKTVKNANSGKEIGISRTGIDKFLSGNFSKEKYASGYVIPQLIETAYKVGEADNHKGKTGINGYEYFESKLLIDGNEYTAHIRIRNTDMGDKYYGHTISATVEEIEIEPSARISDEKSSGQPVNALSSIDNSISQNAEIVNTKSDDFIDKLGAYILDSFSNLAKGAKGDVQIKKKPRYCGKCKCPFLYARGDQH